MTNLIETMARAMCRAMCNKHVCDCGNCDSWQNERDYASAALAAIEAAGYRVVQAEPTEEMHAAGVSATGNHCLTNEVRCAYAAMLAAAPKGTE